MENVNSHAMRVNGKCVSNDDWTNKRIWMTASPAVDNDNGKNVRNKKIKCVQNKMSCQKRNNNNAVLKFINSMLFPSLNYCVYVRAHTHDWSNNNVYANEFCLMCENSILNN